MLSLYLEFMHPYVAPNGECVRYENLNLELYVNPTNEIQEKHNRMIHEISETIRCERYITLVQKDYIALSKDKLSDDFIEYFHNNCKYYGITFTLYFPPLPESVKSINLIETINSDWKFYGIKIR